jgi:XTP/dITP diphosphohydrolase
MQVYFASTNKGKLREVQAIFRTAGIDILSAPHLIEVEETERSFIGNARLKAVANAKSLQIPVLAEDSGLEIDALKGLPGVFSARISRLRDVDWTEFQVGDPTDLLEIPPSEIDTRNNLLILEQMKEISTRTGRYVCAAALADVTGDVIFETEGTCDLEVVFESRGNGGFGYDSICRPVGSSLTFAELTAEQKNAISHRRQAMEKVMAFLTRTSR